MLRLVLIYLATTASFSFFAQKAGNAMGNAGDLVNETLKFTDVNGEQVLIKLPHDTMVLFYRYRGQNWLADNNDSITKVDAIIRQLQLSSPSFKYFKVICYAFNEDHFLNIANLPVFPAGRNYQLHFYFLADRQGNRLLNTGKVLLFNRRGKLLANCQYIASCNYVHHEEQRFLKAKLLTEKNGKKIPLQNVTLQLRNHNNEIASSVETDKYGDFELPLPDSPDKHRLKVESKNSEIQNIILSTLEGVEAGRFIHIADGFEYKIIEFDVARLAQMEEPTDIVTEFTSFVKSSKKEYRRSEFISYQSGSYMIEDSSKKVLEKIAVFMNEHSDVRLEVISHTDSQGEDKQNLVLSENRSLSVVSYLILVGIQKERLTFSGKGETQIRNRCTNGVECSDKEHGYNRRTEFRFARD